MNEKLSIRGERTIVLSDKEQNMKLNFALGQRVKRLRENLNLSRKDLAELVDISDHFLVEIELGRRGVSNVTLCKLADVLCTTTDYLLRGTHKASDVTSITTLLETIEEPLLEGAERLLKEYINGIHYIKAKTEDR